MFVTPLGSRSAIWIDRVPLPFLLNTTRRPSGETVGSCALRPCVSRVRAGSVNPKELLPPGSSFSSSPNW
jgi:hypothetical protein